jgi:hypothetical protein
MADNIDLDDLIPRRIRVPGIFPNPHVTGAQIEQFHVAMAQRGVQSGYRIEAMVVYDRSIESVVQEASYDLGGLSPIKR